MPENRPDPVLRIIDANLNRLREALRVIEEYFRFIKTDKAVSVELKKLRHSLEGLEKGFDAGALLGSRDTSTDPFAKEVREEEMGRKNGADIVVAGFKRAQEASRALEEYIKITDRPALAEKAKTVRFMLYAVEKRAMENLTHE